MSCNPDPIIYPVQYTNYDTFSSTFAVARRGSQTQFKETFTTSQGMFHNKSGIVLAIIGIAALIFGSFSLLFAIGGLLISSACLICTARELLTSPQLRYPPELEQLALDKDPLF